MKSLSYLTILLTMLIFTTSCKTKINNATVQEAKIYGNCEMCEKTIEGAANIKGEVDVDWNKDTKMATITFDSQKTNLDAILKKIADAGYDSDKFQASESAYDALPDCCHYDRKE